MLRGHESRCRNARSSDDEEVTFRFSVSASARACLSRLPRQFRI